MRIDFNAQQKIHKYTDMKKKDYSEMTDEQLFVEKKKQKNARIFHAAFIGFLAGTLIFGMVSWSLSPEKQLGFLIPMLIPIFILYKLLKNPKNNSELEDVLKERQLD
jgi:hypothetical protein